MTPTLIALLAGLLTAKQAEQVAMICTQTAPDDHTIVFQCVLLAEGKPAKIVTSDPVKTDKISNKELAGAWCVGAQEILKFEQQAG